MAIAAATSSIGKPWVLTLLAFIVIGGAGAYHALTSIVRCPGCRRRLVNLRIRPVDAKRKPFSCRECGARAWLAEGFYWQDDFGG